MKKGIGFLLAMILVFSMAPISFGAAAPETPKAKAAILVEQETGRILYEHQADEQLAPASITKVMTMLLVMEAIERGEISLDDIVTTSPYAASMGGSQIWLMIGEQMSVYDLLKATSVVSANDAAVALAEYLGGTEEGFAQMMNDRAEGLSMTNTHFSSACGLDTENHYTSARDISIMSRELLKYDLIKEFSLIWMDTLREGKSQLVNTNRLINKYEGLTGLKTGTTDAAGQCFVGSAERNGLGLVAVILGADTSDERFDETKKLLDWGFANYEVSDIPPLPTPLRPIPVKRGMASEVKIMSEPPKGLVLPKERGSITSKVTLLEGLDAPVQKGEVVGQVEVFIEEELLLSYDLVTAEDVPQMTMVEALLRILRRTVRMK